MNSINAIARLTGVLFIIMTILGPFSLEYVPSEIIVPGDATATANNLQSSESLFRLGIFGNLIVLFTDFGVAILLYVILRPVNRILALTAAVFRLLMVAIRGVNLVNYFLALLLLSGAGYLNAFQPDQLHALVLMFLQGFDSGVFIDLAFFGPHLIFVGYLVYKSDYLPGVLGLFVVLSGLGYLIDSIAVFLFPGYELSVALYTFWGELLLALWLLIKGVDTERWNERALAST